MKDRYHVILEEDGVPVAAVTWDGDNEMLSLFAFTVPAWDVVNIRMADEPELRTLCRDGVWNQAQLRMLVLSCHLRMKAAGLPAYDLEDAS